MRTIVVATNDSATVPQVAAMGSIPSRAVEQAPGMVTVVKWNKE
jgi:hypothetical protein